jgi:hypothetical protein
MMRSGKGLAELEAEDGMERLTKQSRGVAIARLGVIAALTRLTCQIMGVENDNVESIWELILRHGDINAVNRLKQTALHLAAESGASGAVKALLDAGADVNAKDLQGKTPMDLAYDEAVKDALKMRGVDE